MSTSKDIGPASDPSREILDSLAGLAEKIDSLINLPRMPHLSPSTLATALLLTGVTSVSKIATLLGVSRQTIRVGNDFAAFRLAEGALRSQRSVSRRRRSGDDLTDDLDS